MPPAEQRRRHWKNHGQHLHPRSFLRDFFTEQIPIEAQCERTPVYLHRARFGILLVSATTSTTAAQKIRGITTPSQKRLFTRNRPRSHTTIPPSRSMLSALFFRALFPEPPPLSSIPPRCYHSLLRPSQRHGLLPACSRSTSAA